MPPSPPLSNVPLLYVWRKRSLYLGTKSLSLQEYRVTSDQLIVCLEGEIIFKPDSEHPQTYRSLLLKAGTTAQMDDIDMSAAVLAVCYLNPVGQDYMALRCMMGAELEGAYIDHVDEARLIQQLRNIRNLRSTSKEAFAVLDGFIIPPHLAQREFRKFDPRIIKIIQRIRDSVCDNLSIASLAADVHLSESRLVKLFREQIGVPITKHRIRYRVFVGIVHLAVGHSVTEAALAAGFASTAHFSKCFKATVGIQPSATFLSPPYLEVVVADECQQTITG